MELGLSDRNRSLACIDIAKFEVQQFPAADAGGEEKKKGSPERLRSQGAGP
jgi:hypothetical protein